MRQIVVCVFIVLASVGAVARTGPDPDTALRGALQLRENWSIQSSEKVREAGDIISTANYKPSGWFATRVPSTVMAALVENKLYPDIYFGMNLRSVPGCSYKIGQNFSNVAMPEDSPFRSSWWYRTEFRIAEKSRGQKLSLHFDGINFRANIWLNGHKIAEAKEVAGTFRLFEFDISDVAKPGGNNTLAVEVFPPQPDDLALTWVDWNPAPPDKNMGIWHDVYVTSTGPVAIRYPQVISHLDQPSLDTAHLTVNAELKNRSNHAVKGTLRGHIEGIRFTQGVTLAANETKDISFTPEKDARLNLSHPRLWWPIDMGQPNLYEVELEFETEGAVSDRQTRRFGIREITSEIDKDNHRFFKINGRNLLIRGGGWSPDMLLRYRPERLRQEFQYVRDMHLNTIRLEGKLESDFFYDEADRLGILVIAGWCCCDHWEHWVHHADFEKGPVWDDEDYAISKSSLEDQVRRLRNHPSLLAWMNGSDNAPPPDVERTYIAVLQKYQWPNPYISSATAKVSEVTGPSGVKMAGPYEWVPPNYWLLDKNTGGAHGFATEISPGPAVPPIESIRRMIPKEHLWPIDDYWFYHSGGGQFKTLGVFTAAINARYGEVKSVEDYALKSQVMTYEGQRAMFEGYARNRESAGGVIQWMLNNAWPSMIWHLYDYYLLPGGGYFGTKKACEPLHVQYSYDDRSVVVVNNTYRPIGEIKVTAKVFDLNMQEKYSNTAKVNPPDYGNVRAFTIPNIEAISPTYFIKLTLENAAGKTVSSNFYWLSTKDDVLDWTKSTWYYTPTSSLADFTALQDLAPVKLKAAGRIERKGETESVRVTIENPGRSLAFSVRLQINRGVNGDEVVPVLWEDNYIELLPGEKRELTATYRVKDLDGKRPVLSISGWNVEKQRLEVKKQMLEVRG
jgi:exo-1,4-beta-D-glucosaminidase